MGNQPHLLKTQCNYYMYIAQVNGVCSTGLIKYGQACCFRLEYRSLYGGNSSWLLLCRGWRACVPLWPLELCWRQLKFPAGPPMSNRSTDTGLTKLVAGRQVRQPVFKIRTPPIFLCQLGSRGWNSQSGRPPICPLASGLLRQISVTSVLKAVGTRVCHCWAVWPHPSCHALEFRRIRCS